ncbi:aspartate/glutamate racemase family protein [Streptomyces sp. NPDC039022]|uniref:aspartate/glutamate racemase family protein n=1 Tax=unclassified Streptomyces TaxID=2593676 RepID=UPI003409A313
MLALLHTSSVHVPVFDALRDEDSPGTPLRHLVHPDLLDRARAGGPEAVGTAVRDVLAAATGEGAAAILCTCSTIGAVAEEAAAAVGVPVLRVDRPMAAAAVAAGTRVTVLATVESTLRPTADLIAEEAVRADREVTVVTRVVPGAWDLFEAGDQEGYDDAVATAVRAARREAFPGGGEARADAIVLAQASMAPAAERADGTAMVDVALDETARDGAAVDEAAVDDTPAGGTGTDGSRSTYGVVLSSPRLGLRAAVRELTGGN